MTASEEDAAGGAAAGRAVVALFFLMLGAAGLALMPFQTRSSPGDEGWFTQPWLMPLLALILLFAVSLFYTVNLWRDRINAEAPEGGGTLAGELWAWLRTAEFFLWYVAYIQLLGLIGYGLSTFIFIAGLGFRIGLRGPKWLLAALAATLAMTLLFRLGLKIWVPPAALYELLPSGAGAFLQRYF